MVIELAEDVMDRLQGVIPAAGKGVRARPFTHLTHKGMLDINGSPNIQRIIEIMRDQLSIRRIVIIVGYLGDTIKNHFGNGEKYGVEIEYVENTELDKGLAWSIYLARTRISSSYFCIMLCDECYINSNHIDLLQHPYRDYLVTCCGLPVDDNTLIQRNYSICLDSSGQIDCLQEKPVVVSSKIMGTGTFLCSSAIFHYLKSAFDKSEDGFIDFVSTLNHIHQAEHSLGYFQIDGTYVNINDRDSLYLAKYHERKRIFSGSSLGLIVYSEGHEQNVDFTIQRYAELGVFKTITVVLPANNTIAGLVERCGARAVVCPEGMVLYGEKIKHVMALALEDIVILTEADYSFLSRDVDKLLTYIPESDMVIGTRTTRQLIEQGSTMRGLVRMANAILGRLVEVLWWNRGARFTDVGCTFRAIWKSSFDLIKSDLESDGPELSVEMMIVLLNQHQRVIEIPVNYFNRSQAYKRKYQTASTFYRFLKLIVLRRLRK